MALEDRVWPVAEDSDFYEKAYSTIRSDVQTLVRSETYDEDLGQAGWMQAAEAHEFASWIGSGVTSVLDVACGSGGISALLAKRLGAEVTGIDVDPHAVAAGLVLERAEDRSRAVVEVGGRMRAARERYGDEVIAAEGADTFEAFQDFLDVAVSLAAERRLSRWVFHARKASGRAP